MAYKDSLARRDKRAAAIANSTPLPVYEAAEMEKPLRVDWNKHDLAEAYDLVEGVRRASAQHPESGIDGALRDALNAIEAADCEWDSMTKEASGEAPV